MGCLGLIIIKGRFDQQGMTMYCDYQFDGIYSYT
jgi:hypothetical protein